MTVLNGSKLLGQPRWFLIAESETVERLVLDDSDIQKLIQQFIDICNINGRPYNTVVLYRTIADISIDPDEIIGGSPQGSIH